MDKTPNLDGTTKMSSPNAMPTLADLFGDIRKKFFPPGAKVIHASTKDDVRRLLAMGYGRKGT